MLLRPMALLEHPGFVLAALFIVLVGKPLTAAIVTWLMRYPLRTTLSVAVSLAQMASSLHARHHWRTLNVVPSDALDVVVGHGDRVDYSQSARIQDHRAADAETRPDAAVRPEASSRRPRRLFIARSGWPRDRDRPRPDRRTVAGCCDGTDLADDRRAEHDVVRELRERGVSAVYGDASHTDTLVSAGFRTPRPSSSAGSRHRDRRASFSVRASINSTAHIFVRSAYLRDVPPLRQAGAEQVFAGEGEVALAMTEGRPAASGCDTRSNRSRAGPGTEG
jgi:CPA2 family monovalent cation:H+ antiporter-2